MINVSKFEEEFPKDFSDRERISFELGIKLGALFHLAMGMPISKNEVTIRDIERGLESSIKCQPYVMDVKVTIDGEKVLGNKADEFDYSSINPVCLGAEISLRYKRWLVKGVLEWDDENNYPIMYVKELSSAE